jgi:hypothetical protein
MFSKNFSTWDCQMSTVSPRGTEAGRTGASAWQNGLLNTGLLFLGKEVYNPSYS